MSKNLMRNEIRNVILNLEKPFSIYFLFQCLESKGITDRTLILEVLDYMCETGWIKYSEIIEDYWGYQITRKKIS